MSHSKPLKGEKQQGCSYPKPSLSSLTADRFIHVVLI
jgi:hypothetical protein